MATKPNLVRRGGLVIVALIVVAVLIGLRFVGTAVHEGDGTIISLDVAARRASLEVIDPANGATREYGGTIPTNCQITINGKPATLEELRVGDSVHVRAEIDRNARNAEGKRKAVIIARQVQVTREGGA